MLRINEDVTEEVVSNVINECLKQADKGGSRFPGMSYEEGVVAALDWILGYTDENPYPED